VLSADVREGVMFRAKHCFEYCQSQDKYSPNLFTYDKLTFIYLEMPNFTKTEAELETTFDKWMYVLKHLPDLERRPQVLQERVFEKLFSVAEIAKFTPEERQGYEQSLKYYRDLKNVIDASYMEGREEGKAEGKIEGMQERNLEIARQMKADGEPVEKIQRYTGLTEEEIAGL